MPGRLLRHNAVPGAGGARAAERRRQTGHGRGSMARPGGGAARAGAGGGSRVGAGAAATPPAAPPWSPAGT